jgi:hypothetical protein
MWNLWSRKPVPLPSEASDVSGVSIIFLQRRFESFTTERLSLAMKSGWRRDHDPVTFFATAFDDGEGAVVEFNGMFITVQHFDRRLGVSLLGGQEIPPWAVHQAHSSITYACPGGIPVGEVRERFYGLLGLLCAELIDENSSGLFFTEEQVLIRSHSSVVQELRSGKSINPARLATTFA